MCRLHFLVQRILLSLHSCVPLLFLFFLIGSSTGVSGQCEEEYTLQNYTGVGQVVCPCFVAGEEAGVVLEAPAAHYPIEILRIGIGWGSQMGGAPDSLEQSIHIYGAGLPDPGSPIFSLDGPVLTDGAINEFDLEPLPGEVIIDSGPFSVTLEFYNDNVGDPYAPSTVHDGNGCQSGKNLVYAIPGGWYNACSLGISGDWVFYVIYCANGGSTNPAGKIPNGNDVPGIPLTLEKYGTSNLILAWSASCLTADTDYEVYEGLIGNFTSHTSKICTTSGSTGAFITPASGDRYYLVVPNNTVNEGSYGIDSDGVERPVGLSQCLPQEVGVCP
ncbi:hypothetical protein JXQ70_07915 [bacterium]|nr:hypothetical protein [bacterium]